MGFEYMFIDNRVECNWLREFVERPAPLAEQARRDLYDRLTASTLFVSLFDRSTRPVIAETAPPPSLPPPQALRLR